MNPHLQQILHDITVRITKLEEAQQPQRTWVGLTDEEVIGLMKQFPNHLTRNIAQAIEAKLKDKNL
jgi:hypothetical protein